MDEQNEKKKVNRKRDIFIRFMVDEKERDMIYKRMEQTGITNLRAYLLKQAIDGRVIHVELDSVKEMCRLLSNATNNINQIARRVNQTGSIYAADVADLQARCDELWAQTKVILRRLSTI
jgi:ethanolamine ammonia-lyase large subunit